MKKKNLEWKQLCLSWYFIRKLTRDIMAVCRAEQARKDLHRYIHDTAFIMYITGIYMYTYMNMYNDKARSSSFLCCSELA